MADKLPQGSERIPPVWRSTRQLNGGSTGLASLGQGTVAILGGFDLASVGLIVTKDYVNGYDQASAAVLAIAAALFVMALAFITTAEDYSASPDNRLAFFPEATVSSDALEIQRRYQAQDQYVVSYFYNRRILPTVTAAIFLTLVGLSLLLLSQDRDWWLTLPAGVLLLVAGTLVVDWWIDGRWWLFPRPIKSRKQRQTGMQKLPRAERRRRKARQKAKWLASEPPHFEQKLSQESLSSVMRGSPDFSHREGTDSEERQPSLKLKLTNSALIEWGRAGKSLVVSIDDGLRIELVEDEQ